MPVKITITTKSGKTLKWFQRSELTSIQEVENVVLGSIKNSDDDFFILGDRTESLIVSISEIESIHIVEGE